MFHKKSCVVNENVNDEEMLKRFKKKFDSMKLGRRVECGIHLPDNQEPLKTVLKNKKIYYVWQAEFLGLDKKEGGDTYTITRAFAAERKGKFSCLLFMSEADKKGPIFTDERTKVVLDGEEVFVKSNANIFDMLEMRYELRNNHKTAEFIDNFVMTDPKERKQYQKYEAERQVYECMANAFGQKNR